jgi:peptidylprolyl isomerase
MRRKPVLAVALSLALTILAACGLESTEPGTPSNPETETFASSLGIDLKAPGWVKLSPSGVFYRDSVVGTGATAARGNAIQVDYTLYLKDGQRLESSKDAGSGGFAFNLGAGQVIPGWDVGVPGMKVGGIRRLVIPSDYAYGPYGQGRIPANTTLIFDVELRAVR